MKLRLVLSMKSKTGKDVVLKLNVAPSKQQGFNNFVKTAIEKKRPVKIYFEKKSKTGEVERSKVAGEFEFYVEEL
ncbi:MAG: hypothetical protein Kow0069_21330 [Promethearchaeota archaeon]